MLFTYAHFFRFDKWDGNHKLATPLIP
jgi:hypothetical protein